MSRLERRLRKRILTFSIAAIVLIILAFTVGLPLLINTSVFIANLFGKKDTSTNQEEQILSDIEITNILTATNSARIIVSGTTANFDEVQFFLNDEKIEVIDVKNKSNFSQEIGNLEEGENEIYLLAIRLKDNQKEQTPKYTVTYKTGKLSIEILEPSDNSKTSKEEIKVVGKTEKDATLRVNGLPVIVDPNGNFQETVKLKGGENKIQIFVQDQAGNTEEKTLTITFEKD